MKLNTYMMKTSSGKPAPNQLVIEIGGHKFLKSYNSLVACVHADGTVEIGKDWNYSNTTRKFVTQFLGMSSKEIAKLETSDIQLYLDSWIHNS